MRILLPFLFLISFLSTFGSTRYYIQFKDKNSNADLKKEFSAKALEKKARLNIAFDKRDIPVNEQYLQALRTDGIVVESVSKWLNTAVIVVPDGKDLLKYKFITSIYAIREVKTKIHKKGISSVEECLEETVYDDSIYINSYPQFHIMDGEYLHSLGFNGENMTIAVCDAGFQNANTMGAFAQLYSQGRIKGTYDYVHNDSSVTDPSDHNHGTMCLSTIAGWIADKYKGGAINADFYLFQTENAATERIIEEYNLARALERCDSLGVDVVSISLGYTTFDVSSENHDSLMMMQNSTPAAKAVNMAVSKGMVVCVAAGNEGNGSWHYISTPSDADSAIAVAAVDMGGNPASFSGWGLAQDTRVKPNVACVGAGTAVISPSNTVVYGSGTSFACPSMAGFVTCLWQAFPSRTPWQVKTALEQSASKYLNPDKKVGYGIPDFKKAYDLLSQTPPVTDNRELEDLFMFYPVPVANNFSIVALSDLKINSIIITDFSGNRIYQQDPKSLRVDLSLFDYLSGMYFVRINTDKGYLIKKIIKL